jgi:4-diphosphocytidyl-2-C-methyl-D-erythritol kinase
MKEKSYAKVNLFLKIEGYKDGFHQLNSRFMRVKDLYDEIEIRDGDKFDIRGDFDCVLRDNTIFKAYLKLITYFPDIRDYFIGKEIIVTKNIPTMSGLGGGSSNAATFLNMVNKDSGLNLSKDELAKIGAEIGSDVPFFIYEIDVANVYGRGEIIVPYNEDAIEIEIAVPPVDCSTPEVFRMYRERYFNPQKSNFDKIPTMELLENKTPEELNDLLRPALARYSELFKYKDYGYFSGSGSSFFNIKQLKE